MRIAIIDNNIDEFNRIQQIAMEYSAKKNLNTSIKHFDYIDGLLDDYIPLSYDVIFISFDESSADAVNYIRQKDKHTLIIFMASDSSYTADAFNYHAYDYIVMPVEGSRLMALFDDILSIRPCISRCITFTSSKLNIRIRLSELMYFSTSGHYSHIQDTMGNNYTSYCSFRELSSQIGNDPRFLLVNKCIMVNMNYISSFVEKNCSLTNGVFLPVNVRKTKQIEQLWHNFKYANV